VLGAVAAVGQLTEGLDPCLHLVSQTADMQHAQDWLTLPNLEGRDRHARGPSHMSRGRVQDWIEVKRLSSVICHLSPVDATWLGVEWIRSRTLASASIGRLGSHGEPTVSLLCPRATTSRTDAGRFRLRRCTRPA
jgi:hypothetical protein